MWLQQPKSTTQYYYGKPIFRFSPNYFQYIEPFNPRWEIICAKMKNQFQLFLCQYDKSPGEKLHPMKIGSKGVLINERLNIWIQPIDPHVTLNPQFKSNTDPCGDEVITVIVVGPYNPLHTLSRIARRPIRPKCVVIAFPCHDNESGTLLGCMGRISITFFQQKRRPWLGCHEPISKWNPNLNEGRPWKSYTFISTTVLSSNFTLAACQTYLATSPLKISVPLVPLFNIHSQSTTPLHLNR